MPGALGGNTRTPNGTVAVVFCCVVPHVTVEDDGVSLVDEKDGSGGDIFFPVVVVVVVVVDDGVVPVVLVDESLAVLVDDVGTGFTVGVGAVTMLVGLVCSTTQGCVNTLDNGNR